MPDLLQLLQPQETSQALGLPPHALLRVPDPNAELPEGNPLPLVPRSHQTSGRFTHFTLTGRPGHRDRDRHPPRFRTHTGLYTPPHQRVLHAAPPDGQRSQLQPAWRAWV